MRLKKCLVILPLLALTLSGCNNTKVSDSPESSSSSGSEQTSGEITALSNYTLSFTFYSSGIKSSIPDYASAYIIGDWDWNTFLPLTEADGVYSYTFSSIEVGTHEYKGVMWYSDETVSWTNCVEIITQGTGNATFTVRDSDGDGYTQYIDCTLNATLEPKSTEGGEEETSSSESTSEGPTTGGSSSSEEPGTGGSSSSEEPGTGDSSSSSGENPGTGEGSSSDSSSGSGSGNPEEPGTGDSSSSGENPGTGESSSGGSSSGDGEGGDTGGSETFTYSIEVENVTDNTIALSYDGALDTQVGVTLSIKLVTTSSVSGSTSVDANADDVTFTDYDESLITFDGLTVYALNASSSETSFKIVWTAGESATYGPITVSITDDTVQPAESVTNYTLSFTFTLEANGTALSVPENASLYITYGEASNEFGEFEALTDGGNGTYTYTFNTINTDYYAYNIYIGYTNDTWHTADTCYQVVGNSWFTVYGTEEEGHVESIEHVVETDFSEIIPTTYTFYISIYYGDQLQSAPEGTTIYATGVENDWGNFVALTPADNGTYALTVDNLSVSYFNIQLVLEKTEVSNVGYTYRITADGDEGNVFCQVTYCTTSTDVTATAVSALDSLIPADARTTIYNYTLSFTFTYSGTTVSLPTYTSAYISYGPQGSAWGSFIELTSGENNTYYITFDSIDAGTYEYQIILALANTSPSWDDDHMITNGNQTFIVSGTEEDNYTNDITIASKIDVDNTIQDPSTIETRSNCTITYYFVNNASTPTEYYEIPNYADAYICGYLTSTEDWTDYSIGGNTKLSAAGVNASDGYSVTLETIHTGEVTYNMYFEYNTNSQYHSAADTASWSHGIADGTNNTTMNIPTTGECQVYIEVNPSSIITDEPMTNAVNFYILFVDTGSYSSFSWNPWINASGTPFGDSAYCESTVTRTGSSNKLCFYNSIVGIEEAGQTGCSYWAYDTNHNPAIDVSTGTITIPTDTSGYAVYVCYVSFPNGGTGTGSWYTNVSDIATLISSL